MDALVALLVGRLVAVAVFLVGCATAMDKERLGADQDGGIDSMPDAATCVSTGESCTIGTGACQRTGEWVCDDGVMTCDVAVGTPTQELCDGVDNDCDGVADEDFHVGEACDGPDADTCKDGMIVCDGPNATRCTDGPGTSDEICDGIDNDCDGNIDEGFNLNAACDGADTDACNEGFIVCDGAGGTKCSDNTGDNIEKCNGLDDDCRNGADDTFALNVPCTVGLGSCARSGVTICDGAQTGTMCSATAGTPTAELCGNGVDEDCNGADAACPPNDTAAGAIDITNGGTFTVDLAAAHDDNWASATGEDCGDQGGRDVFYTFTLPVAEVVYFDTFGSNYDTVVRVFAGACTSLGAVQKCEDDACSSTRSQGAVQLAAGQYCLVVDQFSSTTTAGATTLSFKRGGRTGTKIATASGSKTGTTTGKTNQSIAGCESNSARPDDAYFFLTCPNTTYTVGANTCSGTAFDSVIYMRSGAATTGDVICADDSSGCGNGLQSKFTGASVSGANLQWLIVDGFGQTGEGAYTLTYTIQ